MTGDHTRGGRKLEAAFAHFKLAAAARGVHALDLGASTGGFVAVLLEQGARHVTAIDVGHGQLAANLARDRRVTSLERTDFKTLSLDVAPGPFDFFTVDVSFVAARSMLRGLAFRLRAGAEGVVLVKPQFELPSHLVKDGQVGAPELRQRAVETFRAKAERLGFELLGYLDSPVAGGSGTVEILAHLRFAGRPESMPKIGERKPVRPNTKKPSQVPGELHWFAVASPGLEQPLCAELAAISAIKKPRVVEGGVEFSGTLTVGMAANLHSRIATRIVLRMGEVKARDFAPLRRGLAKLPWQSYVPRDRALRIDVSTSHCRLYHTGALAETVELAIADCVGKLPKREKPPEPAEDEDCTRILLRGHDDRFTASIDSSGSLLHRRGWRLEAGRAPLRETLAAGLLALCEYDPALPLVDPMCGAGTIAIEAAALARQMAPGLARAFAFERWPVHDASSWQALRDSAVALPSTPAAILAMDRDARAVDTARRNAERAHVLSDVGFAAAAFGKGRIPPQPGLLVVNPPYGHRLGDHGQANRLARDLGKTAAVCYRGWRIGVLCPNPAFLAAVAAGMRRTPSKTHTLHNGGLRVQLAIWLL
ncbi:MAG: SAM-dependent methyltransferase [Polyangia bacterium]